MSLANPSFIFLKCPLTLLVLGHPVSFFFVFLDMHCWIYCFLMNIIIIIIIIINILHCILVLPSVLKVHAIMIYFFTIKSAEVHQSCS